MAVDVFGAEYGGSDLRRPDFEFADTLVGKGGLAKCRAQVHAGILPAADQAVDRRGLRHGRRARQHRPADRPDGF